MSERDSIYDRMDLPRLYGRGVLLDILMAEFDRGCTLFGLDGVTGSGKSQVAERFAWFASERSGGHYITVDLSEWPDETLIVAGLHSRLREIPSSTEREIDNAAAKIRRRITGGVRNIFAAAVADALNFATDKMANVAIALKEEITGEKSAQGVASLVEEQASGNRRSFIKNYMQLIADLGNTVFIAVDNYEVAEPSAQDLVRFLIANTPAYWTLILVNNTEKLSNSDWDTSMTATIELERGNIQTVECLGSAEIHEWWTSELGGDPSEDAIAELIAATNGGRPAFVEEWMVATRSGGVPRAAPDLHRLNSARRSRCSSGARRLAELMALAPADRVLPQQLLEAAAHHDGLHDIGSLLDELRSKSEIIVRESGITFYHASRHAAWLEGLTNPARNRAREAWLAVFREDVGNVLPLARSGLVPVLAHAIVEAETSEVVSDAARLLVFSGVQNEALSLLDASWQTDITKERGNGDVIQHALIAAQTRLDLGRYIEAQEALRAVEIRGISGRQAVEADLIRLNLALRQNAYLSLWKLSEKIEAAAADDHEVQLERQLVVNTAFRDLNDDAGIERSLRSIQDAAENAEPRLRARAGRSIARSLAKLSRTAEALAAAHDSLAAANEQGDIRAIGNAHLALGEVLRYAGQTKEAVDEYRTGEDLARSSGNRDSEIWCLLGQACAHVEDNDLGRARALLENVRRKVTEPGYEHPLELAHLELLTALTTALEGDPVDTREAVLSRYERLGIAWPTEYLDCAINDGGLPATIPI